MSAEGTRPAPHASRTLRPRWPARRVAALLLLGVTAAGLGGCLWEPKIEDKWTRVDLESASVVPGQVVPAGSTVTFTGRTTITYRAILTGAVVAELRASTVSSSGTIVAPDADREAMAAAIDLILQNSVTLGRDTKLVTGWDHLVQPFDFSFSATVPGGTPGVFLVCYLGSAEEVELPGGGDSLVVTPFPSAAYQVLPVGLPLVVGP